MRKSRFSEEQIIGILKEHQAGICVAESSRQAQRAERSDDRRTDGCRKDSRWRSVDPGHGAIRYQQDLLRRGRS